MKTFSAKPSDIDKKWLLINADAGDYKQIGLEPGFVAVVYPAALREVLERILHREKHRDFDDAAHPLSRWLRFAVEVLGVGEPPLETEGEEADDEWIANAVAAFARKHGLLEKFPTGGPKVVWRVPVAGGYAGPAVADGRVFVTDYQSQGNVGVDNFQRKEFTGSERVLCLDAQTGDVKWKHEYPVKYTISYPAGPRCTPVVGISVTPCSMSSNMRTLTN